MRWATPLLLGLCLTLGAVENPPAAPISPADLAELEQLRQKLRDDNSTPTAAPAAAPATGAMSPEDQAEFAALRSQIKARQTETTVGRPILVQLIHTELDGLELVMVLDAPVPTPVVIFGSGHTLGQKFSVSGTFSGAAKFEGAYYSLLKTSEPVVNILAPKEVPKADPDPHPVLGATDGVADDGFGGFQLSNILFAGFAAISLAIVALKVKAKIDAMKGKKSRRR
jgi:hypothetical protein